MTSAMSARGGGIAPAGRIGSGGFVLAIRGGGGSVDLSSPCGFIRGHGGFVPQDDTAGQGR